MRRPNIPRHADMLRGERVSYQAAALPDSVVSLLGGLFAVHTSDGRTTQVSYCEPATQRCSCGARSGDCRHLAAAERLAADIDAVGPGHSTRLGPSATQRKGVGT